MFETVVTNFNTNAQEYKQLCGQLDVDLISKRNVRTMILNDGFR